MKKVFACFILALVSICAAYAQKDVTKFLGIPVDGSKSAMIQKLKAKGFKANPDVKDMLTGEFNGTNVILSIETNGNKVWRIAVLDATPVDECAIRIRFNNLCRQFENNSKYITIEDFTLPDDENISYNMVVKQKRYEAIFYQNPDIDIMKEKIKPYLLEKYTLEELSNFSEDKEGEIYNTAMEYLKEEFPEKPVWFTISEYYGEYCIAMFYDNLYNQANGEDL